MLGQSESQRRYLAEAVAKYHSSLPGSPAAEYLANRGLADVDRFRLGFIAEPLPGHEKYQGMLAIPYLRQSATKTWSVASIRFRCILDHEHNGHGKYSTLPGDHPRLFNTRALQRTVTSVAVTEGELDAVTGELCGLPTVGVPGATSWQPHFPEAFEGYGRVFVLADGDEAGTRFAEAVAKTLSNAVIRPCPDGMDVNAVYQRHGTEAVRELVTP